MKTYLVTGAAGFIGANFIKYLLYNKYKDADIKIVVLDALTYAGNLGTIKDDIDDERCCFVKGDIRDRDLANRIFTDNDIDYVVNFAPLKTLNCFSLATSLARRTFSMPPARPGSQEKATTAILYGNQGSATIRSQPMRYTGH